MYFWIEQMGVLAWPLIFLSILCLVLITERTLFFILHRRFNKRLEKNLLNMVYQKAWTHLIQQTEKSKNNLSSCVYLLLSNNEKTKDQREEHAVMWLQEQQTVTDGHIRWLFLIAVISPLLGLLGTVIGMIDAFHQLAQHQGSVHPSLIANGVFQAMLTTAYGLIIAIPALIAAHSFRIWGSAYMSRLEAFANKINLAMANNTYAEQPSMVNTNEKNDNQNNFKEQLV